jgi:hypothetical protein
MRAGRLLPVFLLGLLLVGAGCAPAGAGGTPTSAADLLAATVAELVVASPTAPPLPAPEATPSTTPPTQERTQEPPDDAPDVVAAYASSPYRVVAVAKNPFAPYTVIVAAERASLACGSPEQPQRCWADESCGSLYTSHACYFFVEPSFDAAAEPETRFVGRWPDFPQVNGLAVDSLRFVDAETLEFDAPGGDGCYAVEEVWRLNLTSGDLTRVSQVEQTCPEP